MEMFVSAVIDMSMTIDVCMDILRCSNQGSGNQLLIAPVAGHFKILKLCAENFGIRLVVFDTA